MALDPLNEFRNALTSTQPCSSHPALRRSSSPEEAALWWETVQLCSTTARREHLRWLGTNDLFFLCVYLLDRKHFIASERLKKWTFERCNEIQDDPDDHVDVWPRESFKTEIISFGLVIFDILNDPEVTFGIFSHNRPMAAKLLHAIKYEFETNVLLKEIYSDILWQEPKTDARYASCVWSDHAITVRRRRNRKEATVEAWGLVDGQPVGSRFRKILYDDVVNRDFVSSDMIYKTTQEFKNSLFLTASDPPVYRYVATYQEIGDTTQEIVAKGILKLRQRGPMGPDGLPAYCSDEKFAALRAKTDAKEFALQILCDPSKSKSDSDVGFKDEWLDYYDELPGRRSMNVYIVVDPAGDSPDSNSHFAMWVLGICGDRRVRVLDMARDKLDLEDSWQILFEAVQKWEPIKVGYEKYGMQRDIEHYHYRQKQINYPFTIVPLGNPMMSKDQRIAELIPWYRERRFLFPKAGLHKKLKNGDDFDILKYFKEREYALWPYNKKERDLLDAQARITDTALGVVYPRPYGRRTEYEGGMGGMAAGGSNGSWMCG